MSEKEFDQKDGALPSASDLRKISFENKEENEKEKEKEEALKEAERKIKVEKEYQRCKEVIIQEIKNLPGLIRSKKWDSNSVCFRLPTPDYRLIKMEEVCDRFNDEGLTDIKISVAKDYHWDWSCKFMEDWWKFDFSLPKED